MQKEQSKSRSEAAHQLSHFSVDESPGLGDVHARPGAMLLMTGAGRGSAATLRRAGLCAVVGMCVCVCEDTCVASDERARDGEACAAGCP